MIYQKIKQTLTDIGVPAEMHYYEGKEKTYITYFVISETPVQSADDRVICTRYSVQIDIWSFDNYDTLSSAVESAMLGAGFSRGQYRDFYEQKTKLYHRVMRFSYLN